MTPADAPAKKILAAHLYRNHRPAFCCAGAGLLLTNAQPITGPPDTWLLLPDQDWWS